MTGRFITLEGGEGCGKSTQAARLYELFRDRKVPVRLTREPGGTALGQQLRQLLLTQDAGTGPGPLAELLMYAADRAEHLERVIRPDLDGGVTVICDRFTDSTVAYQGYGRGLDFGLIAQLNDIATGGLAPDLTLWLQLDPELGLARSGKAGGLDRLEGAGLDFHRRVYQGFEILATQYPKRIRAIDARGDTAQVFERIKSAID